MNDAAWRRSICRVGQTLSALVLAGAAIGLLGTTVRAAPAGPPPVPVLSWTDCGGGFQCATAQVPLDYERPRGRAISIALIRLPASVRDGRPSRWNTLRALRVLRWCGQSAG
jgi:hypothetical protein